MNDVILQRANMGSGQNEIPQFRQRAVSVKSLSLDATFTATCYRKKLCVLTKLCGEVPSCAMVSTLASYVSAKSFLRSKMSLPHKRAK